MQAVVEALSEHGVEAFEVDEDGYVSVEVPCGKGDTRDCDELIADIEAWLSARGLPFVPEEVDGRIVIRPPATRVAEVTVRGEAVVPVAPDYLAIRLTVTEVRQGADEAYDDVASRSAALADLLTELGIDASARSTSAVVVRAEREYDDRGRPTHRGYSATSSTHVRLANPAVAASVIKQAVARTGAQIEGPWWEVAPENPARFEACRQAALIARSKAGAYAEALGVRLGALTEVAEPDPRIAPAGYRPVQAGFGPLFTGDEPEIPIAAGTLEVRSAVDVTFSIVAAAR